MDVVGVNGDNVVKGGIYLDEGSSYDAGINGGHSIEEWVVEDWNNGDGVMWLGGLVMNAVVGDSCIAEGGGAYGSSLYRIGETVCFC